MYFDELDGLCTKQTVVIKTAARSLRPPNDSVVALDPGPIGVA